MRHERRRGGGILGKKKQQQRANIQQTAVRFMGLLILLSIICISTHQLHVKVLHGGLMLEEEQSIPSEALKTNGTNNKKEKKLIGTMNYMRLIARPSNNNNNTIDTTVVTDNETKKHLHDTLLTTESACRIASWVVVQDPFDPLRLKRLQNNHPHDDVKQPTCWGITHKKLLMRETMGLLQPYDTLHVPMNVIPYFVTQLLLTHHHDGVPLIVITTTTLSFDYYMMDESNNNQSNVSYNETFHHEQQQLMVEHKSIAKWFVGTTTNVLPFSSNTTTIAPDLWNHSKIHPWPIGLNQSLLMIYQEELYQQNSLSLAKKKPNGILNVTARRLVVTNNDDNDMMKSDEIQQHYRHYLQQLSAAEYLTLSKDTIESPAIYEALGMGTIPILPINNNEDDSTQHKHQYLFRHLRDALLLQENHTHSNNMVYELYWMQYIEQQVLAGDGRQHELVWWSDTLQRRVQLKELHNPLLLQS